MEEIAKETLPANLEQEMRRSYLDYAMSVIVGRALPDVRDGLKPVHRRVLYAMSVLGNEWNKPYKKSARVVGDVIGKYHPHGDTAVYDAIVRLAQSFSLRYPLVDGQGNFGSVDGDSPAAMRYTEIRLARIAHELLDDLDRETVDFVPNYDETEHQPAVLPARFPNLLVNGSTGIAVGMATNIPPHNLSETISACLALIDQPEVSFDKLIQLLPGPDFPTSGIINGSRGIREAYETGRGRIHVRARVDIETIERNDRTALVAVELPYQVNKARLLEKIAQLVRDKRLEGISGLRDESDKSGMRMVIELKKGENPEVVLNNLYQHTQMQTVFGINLVALRNNQPRLFNLRELLDDFVLHRREVVTRRTLFDLRKARARAHLLEGLAVALANLDPVIELIKKAANPGDARSGLLAQSWNPGVISQMLLASQVEPIAADDVASGYGMVEDGYRLSEVQAQAILDLRLHRLTGLEQEKIRTEYSEILERIRSLLEILEDPDRLMQVVRKELVDIRDRYGDARRTEIIERHEDLNNEDLITPEDMVVTLSHEGYAKSQPVADYQAQRRGGKGRVATRTKEADFVKTMFVANTHDTVMCFSDRGKVYWLKVYQLPQAGRQARGRPLVNLLPLQDGERVTAVLPLNHKDQGQYVFMVTRQGISKKCLLENFSRPRSAGLIAVDLNENDELVEVGLTDGESDILLFTSAGKVIRFSEGHVRSMGRTARGVRGIKLKSDQAVISMLIINSATDEAKVLIATENGYGKRTELSDFPRKNRGGQGVIAIKVGERNGLVVGAQLVLDDDDLILITGGGRLVRTRAKEITVVGRNTQGVRLMRLGKEEQLTSLGKVVEEAVDELGPDEA
ncbi:MAG: DNA gyrase subunit A [Acidiferrobacteraceae bacterium]|jgi:DNA gyrase subunit A|nr:DNA gyrase subunit A [Acidiferrobacteraceae bacterium]MBT3640204.1 DNA gyrase subunit A [Acidiferrobacteraceae bacterium]MBT3973045.1 DNA gyrase subunit A [Acidiferrobacteraceae bacterium]MBT4396238.1 DNA gyrase subunit A [Acidiferrobacteraceae bacterium]MBT4406031.1 DNA gyrase subunit A [Acidiferrobacteraceae bacterium]